MPNPGAGFALPGSPIPRPRFTMDEMVEMGETSSWEGMKASFKHAFTGEMTSLAYQRHQSGAMRGGGLMEAPDAPAGFIGPATTNREDRMVDIRGKINELQASDYEQGEERRQQVIVGLQQEMDQLKADQQGYIEESQGQYYSKQEAEAIASERGVDPGIFMFSDFVHKDSFAYHLDLKDREQKWQNAMQTMPQTLITQTGQLGMSLLGSMVDPVGAASGFVPVGHGYRVTRAFMRGTNKVPAWKKMEAAVRSTSLEARMAGKNWRQRLGARAWEGGVDATAVNMMLEPFIQQYAAGELRDYTAYDSALNLLIGGIAGAGLRGGMGALSDGFARARGQLPGDEARIKAWVDESLRDGNLVEWHGRLIRPDEIPPVEKINQAVDAQGNPVKIAEGLEPPRALVTLDDAADWSRPVGEQSKAMAHMSPEEALWVARKSIADVENGRNIDIGRMRDLGESYDYTGPLAGKRIIAVPQEGRYELASGERMGIEQVMDLVENRPLESVDLTGLPRATVQAIRAADTNTKKMNILEEQLAEFRRENIHMAREWFGAIGKPNEVLTLGDWRLRNVTPEDLKAKDGQSAIVKEAKRLGFVDENLSTKQAIAQITDAANADRLGPEAEAKMQGAVEALNQMIGAKRAWGKDAFRNVGEVKQYMESQLSNENQFDYDATRIKEVQEAAASEIQKGELGTSRAEQDVVDMEATLGPEVMATLKGDLDDIAVKGRDTESAVRDAIDCLLKGVASG